MKGLEVSIQEILSSMQVRKIKSTNDINCLRCSYNSFLPILNHLSLLAKFHLSSQKLFYEIYHTRFEANHKHPAWACVPFVYFVYFISHVFVCVVFFLHVICISKKGKKEKKRKEMYSVHVCIYLRRWLGCTNKKTCHSVHQYRFLPLTIWNLIIPKSCVRVGL